VAKKLGFKVFALQDSGWCASSSTAEKTFNKYGMSLNCENDGEGGPNANQVYYIKGINLQLKQFTPFMSMCSFIVCPVFFIYKFSYLKYFRHCLCTKLLIYPKIIQ